jgi:hypothetical protein
MAISGNNLSTRAGRGSLSAMLIGLMSATVPNQTEASGHLRRSGPTHQPKSFGDASTEPSDDVGGRARIRTWDRGVMSPLL